MHARIDGDLIEWIDAQIENRHFANRSHALEYTVHELVERERKRLKGADTASETRE